MSAAAAMPAELSGQVTREIGPFSEVREASQERAKAFCGLVHCSSPLGAGRIGAVFVTRRWTREPDKRDRLFRVPPQRLRAGCHPCTATILRALAEGPSSLAPNWTNLARGGSK